MKNKLTNSNHGGGVLNNRENVFSYGFTLIELLGVIILLGIIGLITYPIVNNSIKESKEKSYMETIRNIEDAAYRYSIEQNLNDDGNNHTISISKIQNAGLLKDNEIINPITNQSLNGCIIYKWKEATKQYEFKYDEECNVPDIPVEKPTIVIGESTGTSNHNGWYKEDFYVAITGNGKSYRYCIDVQQCNPITVVNSSSGNVLISTESSSNYVCAQAMNGDLISEVICSGAYKLDKTAPSIEGINDITIQKGSNIDLSNGVSYRDTISGIEGSLSITPTSIDTTKTGTTNVTYKIVDKAGNERSVIRKVIVDANGPLITYTVQGNPINSNGWAKNDFYVKGTIQDQSGLGIKSAKWCSSTSGTCTPDTSFTGTEVTPLISSESNNNRICIQATDNNNKTSEVICSNTYRLDKTKPTPGTATFTGTLGSNSWYTSDVTVNIANGSDSLSGPLSTFSNISSITSNTTGTTITITTNDLAGNSATRDYSIKVDKISPTLTAKSGTVTITKGDSNAVSNYFNTPSYSISGGSLSCSPTTTSGLESGNQTVTCTATGGNGLKTVANKTILVEAIKTLFIYTTNTATNTFTVDGVTKTLTPNTWVEFTYKDTSVFQFYHNTTCTFNLKAYYGNDNSVNTSNYNYASDIYLHNIAGSATTLTLDSTVFTNNINANGNYLFFQYYCFTGETKVLCYDPKKKRKYKKKIKDIQVGDIVITYNERKKQSEFNKVSTILLNNAYEIYEITVANNIIKTTAKHPFYVVGKGYINAEELLEGDVLLDSLGNEIGISKIRVTQYQKPIPVYNINVEGNHNYYVSDAEILVHNKAC